VSAEARLAALGITLPDAVTPLATYVTARRSGKHLYLSGHLGKRDGVPVTGAVGDSVTREEAQELARLATIDLLASARTVLGTLDAVRAVVKVTGFVRSAQSFTEQSFVINGASDLLVEVFGEERGRHARSAVGVAQLPLGAAVEIEAILEVE
jgi:enamine deaminase RidA (YjgF/YER057c/UK114 family)